MRSELTLESVGGVQVGGDIVVDSQVWSRLGGRKGVAVGDREVGHLEYQR